LKIRYKYLLISFLMLLSGLFVHYLYINHIEREEIYARRISEKIQGSLKQVTGDQQRILEYLRNTDELNFSEMNELADHPVYIYRFDQLVYWSDNLYTPERSQYLDLSGYVLINEEDRKLLMDISTLEKNNVVFHIVSVIPLFIRYDISNEYLESGYNEQFFEGSEIVIHSGDGHIPVVDLRGDTLFQVEFLSGYVAGFHWLPVLIFTLIGVGIILLLVFLVLHAGHLHQQKGIWIAAFTLMVSLILIRIIMLIAGFPFDYLNLEFFDSRYYASSLLNPSLGDLFLNIIFLLIFSVFVFFNYAHRDLIRFIRRLSGWRKNLLGFGLITVFLAGSLIVYKLIQSLGTHSQWSMDIADGVYFDSFKWFSYFLFALSVLIYIQFTYFLNKIILRLYGRNFYLLMLIYLVSFGFFLGAALLLDRTWWLVGAVTGIFIFFSWYLDIKTIFIIFQYKTFVYLLGTFIVISIIGCIAIDEVRRDMQKNQLNRFGEQLIQENDPLAEFFLSEAYNRIQEDVFIKNRLFSPFGSKEMIEEKIRRIHLNNYLDKYEITVFLYNRIGEPLYSGTPITYHEIRQRYARNELETEFENIYFSFSEKAEWLKRYLVFIPISQYNTIAGYIIMDLRLKKIIPTKVYPRLLLDDVYTDSYLEDQYDYALYQNYSLINSSGSYNYERNFDKRFLDNYRLYQNGLRLKNFIHYGFRVDREKVYVISKPRYPFSNVFANFSFLFLILAFFLLLTLMVYAVYFNIKKIEINYITRIQLYLNLAFFIPLTVISLTTLTRSASDYKTDVENEYLRIAEATSNNITGYLHNFLQDQSTIEELSSKLSELADFSELDMDIFRILQNPGRLLLSTQPLIYEKDIFSELIDPVALSSIMEQGNKSIILDESFGKLEYKTAYVNIRTADAGELIGILSIPFFGSQEAIEQNLTGLVINILSIFTIIFISFIFLSYFVSNYLTFPLKFLTERIRKTSLTGSNEPIQYESQDEIGQLISEYNHMLLKLEESRKALAQSEKEAAWREMAKQVAHEIKNPLTPMKLTLQHLKMRIGGEPEEKARLEKSINSLLHNIDTLSNIATTFSNYAQMPMPEKEEFDITGLLKQTVNIYLNNEEGIDIRMDIPDRAIMVEGDPGWIGRTISNLIINGIQAVEKGKKPELEIMLREVEPNKMLLSVADNGQGISDDIQDKIFMPNFSTKYSGSGIGLAIAKRAIEHAQGKIWFETKAGEGTIFYIQLPVIF
jgi:two-component system, NtrC family, nitrogen regulation sensor histidine kinase NtrY